MSGTAAQKRVIGVGVIGAGWMGRLHSNAYLEVPKKYPELGIEINPVAVADAVEANGRALQQTFGFRSIVSDYRELLANPEVDVVSICSPNFLHREMALAAVAAGKPFWIEKPMGAGPADSQAIAEAVAAADLPTAVGFNYRHAPAVEHARSLVKSGDIGEVRNIHVWLNADYSADPDAPRTWRYERAKAGTGVLGDLLSHGTDLAQYLVGAAESISAVTKTFVKDRWPVAGGGIGHRVQADLSSARLPVENEDFAALLVRFRSGAVGTFESSRIAVGPRCDYGFEVYGAQGTLRWDFERMNEIDVCLKQAGAPYGFTRVMSDGGFGEFLRFQPGAGNGMSFDDLKTIEGMQFLRSVVEGRPLAPNVADGYAAASIVAAAEQSVNSGTWQTLPEPIGTPTFDAH